MKKLSVANLEMITKCFYKIYLLRLEHMLQNNSQLIFWTLGHTLIFP